MVHGGCALNNDDLRAYREALASLEVEVAAPRMSAQGWRSLLGDLQDLIVWTTDASGVLTLAEGGGVRSLSDTSLVGHSLADFGADSLLQAEALPKALGGSRWVGPSWVGPRVYSNLCWPRRSGRGAVAGLSGVSLMLDDDMVAGLKRIIEAYEERSRADPHQKSAVEIGGTKRREP